MSDGAEAFSDQELEMMHSIVKRYAESIKVLPPAFVEGMIAAYARASGSRFIPFASPGALHAELQSLVSKIKKIREGRP